MKQVKSSHTATRAPTVRSISKDMIDVVDEQGNPTGEVFSRKEIHQLGKLHRAIHLYLFDPSNNLLLQKRSSQVDHYPNVFSISVTGHVDAGENSHEAVVRELQEELGLDPAHVQLGFLFSLRQDAQLSPTYIDRQLNDVYVGWADFKLEDIVFDREAISEVKLVPFPVFETMVKQSSPELAAVYQEECNQLIELLVDRLNLNGRSGMPHLQDGRGGFATTTSDTCSRG